MVIFVCYVCSKIIKSFLHLVNFLRDLTCGEEINEAIENAVDPSNVESILSSNQIEVKCLFFS